MMNANVLPVKSIVLRDENNVQIAGQKNSCKPNSLGKIKICSFWAIFLFAIVANGADWVKVLEGKSPGVRIIG